ncbi:MAG: hypothetical protein RHS_4851 [Robinsoniella sp. RHS]|nr:MAG: hypothetical protein RHS_4851 [Robinsoniella sp. RHS]
MGEKVLLHVICIFYIPIILLIICFVIYYFRILQKEEYCKLNLYLIKKIRERQLTAFP